MTRAVARLQRSPILAAFLSFLLPGLGQGLLGRLRRALLLALPVLVLVGFVIGIYLQQGRARTLGIMLQPGVLVALLIVNLVLLAWRGGAIIDAYRLGRRASSSMGSPRARTLSTALVVILLMATLGMHLSVGFVALKAYDTVAAVFVTPEPTASPAPPSSAPTAVAASMTPEPTTQPTPEPGWLADGRLDVLLVGGDAGPGRASLRTDSMILLSVDVATGRAALSGIPRNLFNVPLPAGPAALFPECGCYPDLLNSLFVFAMQRPQVFRGGDARGYLALQDAVEVMTGQKLDGMLVVTLQGFVRLVDALGGLDITTPSNLYDASYPDEDGIHHEQIWIPAGPHHLDGHLALAYARSRHQDNDYNRMERQQLVLTALRRQICPGDLIFRIPELLDIARDSLWTDIPVGDMPDLLELGNRVHTDRLVKHQFWPPAVPEYLNADGLALIRQIVADPWGPDVGASANPAAPTATPVESGC